MEFSTLNGYKVKDKKAIRYYDTVADMKSDTTLKNGMHVKTKGYYSVDDSGHGEYIILNDNTLVSDNGLIHTLTNGLKAKLIIDYKVNALQLGCKTDGTDNSTILNNYFSKGNESGIYFPKGNYYVNNEIDTIGSVEMDKEAWIIALSELDCVVHINKNLVIPEGSFANNSPKNLEYKINVDCDKKASTGIRTDKLQWAKLTLSVKNPTQYGVYTRYNTSYGCAENTYDIQVLYDTEDGTNTSTGLYVGGSDDIYNSVISINTKYGVDLHGGDNSFGTIHCWLVNSDLWSGSIMLKTSSVKNHINNLIADTYETAIGKSSNFNVSTSVFGLFIDFMYGLINTTFIPENMRSSYKIWDFTGLTGTAKNNSVFHIMNYVGNDSNTAKISVADDGNCPFNTKLGYQDDYSSPKWIYSLNNCPEGSFLFTGDTNAIGKPSNVTSGNFVLITKNSSYGKDQEISWVGLERTPGSTTYTGNTPTGNFAYYYKRTISKFNVGNNPWGQFASYYIADTYTPSE